MVENIFRIFEENNVEATRFSSFPSIKSNYISNYADAIALSERLNNEASKNIKEDKYIFHANILTHFEYFFDKKNKEKLDKDLLLNILPLILGGYDAYLSVVSGFYNRSNLTMSVVGRSLFEGLIILLTINNDKNLAKQYYRYKEIEKLKFQMREEEITNEEFLRILKNDFPEWYSEIGRIRRKKIGNWLGVEQYSLRDLAVTLDKEKQYKSFYKVYSLYSHMQPSIINHYNLSGGVLNTNLSNLNQQYCIMLDIAFDYIITIYKLFGLDDLAVDLEAQKNITLFSLQKYQESL
ncbi:MAG: DUF5677 domain-containing protein [Bdellovibrionaceae bacterium]|nr:DUF5677 domain-containing protein [Pseudobdellovibrionaceae bacterium]